LFFFFFQAEDGIRDRTVTGVQTCALPILVPSALAFRRRSIASIAAAMSTPSPSTGSRGSSAVSNRLGKLSMSKRAGSSLAFTSRSEERRVGKECRSRWGGEEEKEIRK